MYGELPCTQGGGGQTSRPSLPPGGCRLANKSCPQFPVGMPRACYDVAVGRLQGTPEVPVFFLESSMEAGDCGGEGLTLVRSITE